MQQQIALQLIQDYYTAFNEKNMPRFLSLLSEDIVHDINQGHQEIGKQAFVVFMERMNHSYQEHIAQLAIMTNTQGTRAAAEFIVNGTYTASASGLPEATGQQYSLPCGAFFEIKQSKIARVTNYYNLQNWLKQVQA